MTGSVHLSPEGVEEFNRRLAALAKEFDCGDEAAGAAYKLLVTLCPEAHQE